MEMEQEVSALLWPLSPQVTHTVHMSTLGLPGYHLHTAYAGDWQLSPTEVRAPHTWAISPTTHLGPRPGRGGNVGVVGKNGQGTCLLLWVFYSEWERVGTHLCVVGGSFSLWLHWGALDTAKTYSIWLSPERSHPLTLPDYTPTGVPHRARGFGQQWQPQRPGPVPPGRAAPSQGCLPGAPWLLPPSTEALPSSSMSVLGVAEARGGGAPGRGAEAVVMANREGGFTSCSPHPDAAVQVPDMAV